MLNLAQGSAQRRRQASRVAAADIAEDEDDVYGSRATEARSPLASGSNEDGAEGEEGLASSEEEDLPMTGKLYPEWSWFCVLHLLTGTLKPKRTWQLLKKMHSCW